MHVNNERALPLDRYDPWTARLVIIFLGLIGFAAVVAICILSVADKDTQGFFAIPIAAITTLSMLNSRRPPWTARGS